MGQSRNYEETTGETISAVVPSLGDLKFFAQPTGFTALGTAASGAVDTSNPTVSTATEGNVSRLGQQSDHTLIFAQCVSLGTHLSREGILTRSLER